MFTKYIDSYKDKTVIWSHRGGYAHGPENSIKVFEKSIEDKVEGVEADVWMSKDGYPMVLHGLGNGNMRQYDGLGRRDKIFRWTKDELQTIDIGEGQHIPTVDEFLELFKDEPEIMLYLDLKVPYTLSLAYYFSYD